MAGKAGDAGAQGNTAAPGAAGAAAPDAAAAAAAAAAAKAGTAPDTGGAPAPEAKTGDQGAAGDQAAADAAGAKKAPASYTWTVPDTAKMFVQSDQLSELEQLARENDWTQEEAQAALLEFATKAESSFAKQVQAWETRTKADKTYGGEHLAESQQLGSRVIDRFMPQDDPLRAELLAILKEGGAGVRLPIVALLARIGRSMGEDKGAAGRSTGSSSSGDKASKMYDHPSSRKLEEEIAGR